MYLILINWLMIESNITYDGWKVSSRLSNVWSAINFIVITQSSQEGSPRCPERLIDFWHAIIHGILISMSYDLAHHMDSFLYSLIIKL